MLLSNLIYIPLRIFRKFFFTGNLLTKYGKFLPFYEVNLGQKSPISIVDEYCYSCQEDGIYLSGKEILEIGIGATNATGYEFAARGISFYWGYEPFIPFDRHTDQKHILDISKRYNSDLIDIESRVKRINSTKDIKDKSIDIIFSHSVLEHVKNLPELLEESRRMLKENGCMVHVVDYRDHFFRYPFHYLQFSERTWNTFLNPGDLTRYRLKDHIDVFNRYGFSVDTIKKSFDYEEFNKIKDHLNKRFRNYEPDKMAITKAVLLTKREQVEV